MATNYEVLQELVKRPRDLHQDQRERIERVLVPAIRQAAQEVTDKTIDNIIWRVGEILGVDPREFINYGS